MTKSFTQLLAQPIVGKVVLVRVDFNVPLKDGCVMDTTRVEASLETIQSLTDSGAKVVLISHLNRPGGKVVESARLTPVRDVLQSLLNKPVTKVDDCIGASVERAIGRMANGDVLLLENSRFYPEEEANDAVFSKTLAGYCDYFVQDAFGAVHRRHASTYGVATYLPAYAGQLVDKELHYLSQVVTNPGRPFLALIGGSKMSSKFSVLKNLLSRVDGIILGGAMVYTLLKAQGKSVGLSLVEDDLIPDAHRFLQDAHDLGKSVYLPEDHVVVTDVNQPSTARVVRDIPSDCMAVDIGPASIAAIQQLIGDAQMVFWNGPVGIFEVPAYAKGTLAIAHHMANATATTIVGGGHCVAAVNQAGCAHKMDHVSTGGGASLAYIEGCELPGLAVLA
jgi:phosphoglycerate kinase